MLMNLRIESNILQPFRYHLLPRKCNGYNLLKKGENIYWPLAKANTSNTKLLIINSFLARTTEGIPANNTNNRSTTHNK